MSALYLVTGGRRSGKSAYAQRLAEGLGAPRVYLATCPVLDEEMAARVEAHRVARAGKGWATVEEPVNVAGAIRESAGAAVILVECVTLWVNNLMFEAGRRGEPYTQTRAMEDVGELIGAARGAAAKVVLVTNEVGWGIVPGDALSRAFADAAGAVNQALAAAADAVTLVACGLPLQLKERGDGFAGTDDR